MKRMTSISIFPGKEFLMKADGEIRSYVIVSVSKHVITCMVNERYREAFNVRDIIDIIEGKNKEYELIEW